MSFSYESDPGPGAGFTQTRSLPSQSSQLFGDPDINKIIEKQMPFKNIEYAFGAFARLVVSARAGCPQTRWMILLSQI